MNIGHYYAFLSISIHMHTWCNLECIAVITIIIVIKDDKIKDDGIADTNDCSVHCDFLRNVKSRGGHRSNGLDILSVPRPLASDRRGGLRRNHRAVTRACP